MDAGTWVALIAALLATIIAVIVPVMTFRLALRQDHARWIREQRADLYMDMLTEAYAEQEWLKLETADTATQERARQFFVDKRLPPAERARLGTRGTILGSRAVNRRFNEIGAAASRLLMASRIKNNPDAIQMLIDVQLSGLIDQLHKAIRLELGVDRVPLDSAPGAGTPAGDPYVPSLENLLTSLENLPRFDSDDEDPPAAP